MDILAQPLPKHPAIPARAAIRDGIKLGLFYGAGLTLFRIACEFFQVGPLPVPTSMDFFAGMGKALTIVATLAFMWISVLGVFFLPFKATRSIAIISILGSLVPFAMAYGSFEASSHLRTRALIALGKRTEPLVNAIRSYENDHGTPPPSLHALVPNYLAKVPGTGMGSCPEFNYDPKGLSTGTWYVGFYTTDARPFGIDQFFYAPTGDWENRGGERYGDWIYLHDDRFFTDAAEYSRVLIPDFFPGAQ